MAAMSDNAQRRSAPPIELAGTQPDWAVSLPAPRQIAAAILAAAIFAVDSFTTLGSAPATLYVLVLLVACDRQNRSHLLRWSALCASLTVASFLFVHGTSAHVDATVRVIISLGAIAVTTGMLLHRQVMDVRVARGERRHEDMLNALAVAIWEHDFTPVEAAIAEVRANGVTDLRAYLEANPGFVSAARALVRITDVNQTALDMMGVTSKHAFFQRLSDFLPLEDESFQGCILAIDERRDMFQAETQVIAANGEPIDIIVAFSLSPHRSLDRVPGSILDIRQRKRLELAIERARLELEKVHRAAAMGAMSASIAHEINQPLSAIQSFSNSAIRWLDRDAPNLTEVRQSLVGLNSAVTNVYEVMQRIRNLVGSSRGEAARVNLRSLICDTVAFANRDAEVQGAKVAFAHGGGDVTILGDSVLLKHLLMNLITNALQAMEGISGGEKLIEIDLQSINEVAHVTIRDRGPGLASSICDNQFEPFFTTKAGGMGLGLSICRSIVELHDGEISLTNHPLGGAKVSLSLPAQA